jgi:hypothetical protein
MPNTSAICGAKTEHSREISNRQHCVSKAFPVNMAEAKLAKKGRPPAMRIRELKHHILQIFYKNKN